MNKYDVRTDARYGIDIRGLCSHAEANELAQVLALLYGHVGKVRVVDRRSHTVVFDGTVDEVRESICAFSASQADKARVTNEVLWCAGT